MKRMAHRAEDRLAWLPGDRWMYADHDPRLDVNREERVKQVIGVLFFAVVLIAVCLLSGGPS